MLKHIGIVDITTVGACICANTIIAEAAKRDDSGVHPEFTMHSLSFDLYKKAVLDKNWSEMAKLICRSIKKLQATGIDFAIIPSNTPHYAYDLFASKVDVPILNLIDITAQECADREFKKVAILGTEATMSGGLYDRKLQDFGIDVVIPNSAARKKIHNFIMDEIIPSKIKSKTQDDVKKEICSLDCDAVILGCTELPEVYSEESLGVNAVDTTRLLAMKALSYAYGSDQ